MPCWRSFAGQYVTLQLIQHSLKIVCIFDVLSASNVLTHNVAHTNPNALVLMSLVEIVVQSFFTWITSSSKKYMQAKAAPKKSRVKADLWILCLTSTQVSADLYPNCFQDKLACLVACASAKTVTKTFTGSTVNANALWGESRVWESWLPRRVALNPL